MFLTLLFFEGATEAVAIGAGLVWWQVLLTALVAQAPALILWFRSRKKDKAELDLTEGSIDAAKANLLVLNAKTFDDFLSKLYDAKMLIVAETDLRKKAEAQVEALMRECEGLKLRLQTEVTDGSG